MEDSQLPISKEELAKTITEQKRLFNEFWKRYLEQTQKLEKSREQVANYERVIQTYSSQLLDLRKIQLEQTQGFQDILERKIKEERKLRQKTEDQEKLIVKLNTQINELQTQTTQLKWKKQQKDLKCTCRNDKD